MISTIEREITIENELRSKIKWASLTPFLLENGGYLMEMHMK